MTPEEKINYALSLVEGATPGPWAAEDEYDPAEQAWIVLGGGAAGRINEFAVAAALGGYAAISEAEWVKANAQQIALSPLIPAALRLALAVGDHERAMSSMWPSDRERVAMYAALDAFLSLLPEPQKDRA